MNLPEKYTESMKMMLGDEYDSYIESFNDKRLYGLRVNNLKISTEDFLKICPFKLEPVPWIENGFYYSEDDKPAKHPYYFAGLYYIQEPSAMTPANVLPIDEGDVVFDMCAAPGGKSTELAAKLNKTGLLITNDISNSRAKALLKNVEVFGVPNLCVLNEDPVGIASRFSGFFDKVLIDAPCSGEGMFRKDNKLIKAWEKNGPEFYSQIQRNIILAGADMLKPGAQTILTPQEKSTLFFAAKQSVLPMLITGYQFISMLCDMNKNSEEPEYYFEKVKLSQEIRDKHIGDYSFEEKKRLQLAAFLIQKPYVMMFDEALDYCTEEYIDDMLDVLNEVKDEHIILMSTGLLDIAHRISRDVVVLNNGELNLISYETMQIPEIKKAVLDILGEADNEII